MKVVRTREPDREAAARLNEILKDTAPILLLLSGGSAFELLHKVNRELLGPHLTIGVLDERYAMDSSINNYEQLKQTPFLTSAVRHGAETIETSVCQDISAETLCRNWEKALRAWKAAHPNGKIVTTMGIGNDGHTSGILPVDTIDFEVEDWTLAYVVAPEVNEHTERITTTHTFLRDMVDEALVYVVGKSKQNALTAVLAEEGSIQETPARILREMKNVIVYTDITDI